MLGQRLRLDGAGKFFGDSDAGLLLVKKSETPADHPERRVRKYGDWGQGCGPAEDHQVPRKNGS